MKLFIYRNTTIETLFKGYQATFSGYGNIFGEDTEDSGMVIWFYTLPLKISTDELINEIEDYKTKLNFLFQQTDANKTFIVFTLENFFNITWENADVRLQEAINSFNNEVFHLANSNNNVKIFQTKDFLQQIPNDKPLIDWKYYYFAQNIINPKLASNFSKWFGQKIQALASKRKKCLVLDLDNTMWGGILGEDGIDGIKLGNTYPGAAFSDFQNAVLEASKNGIILAVCSKNNEEDVLEAWDKNPFMIVKREHISAYRINWNDKPSNIVEIADELNIGLDSMVFIDDNPIERGRVKEMLPQVEVPDFPEQPFLMLPFFNEIYKEHFQIYQLTNEDKSKTAQYTANAKRETEKRNFQDIDAYLGSLEMELEVQFANTYNTTRIAQMTQKTNQFNLTTRRYTENDINDFVKNGDLVSCLSVKDKFGDNGITVLSIIKITGNSAEIDSFLLSCRILGRGIEKTYLDFLMNFLFDKGINIINATFVPSSKNKQTKDFYEKNGFQLIDEDQDGIKNYSLKLIEKRSIKDFYKLKIV